jgi:hypothetical protein
MVARHDIEQFTRGKQEIQMILEERLKEKMIHLDAVELFQNPRKVCVNLYLEEGLKLFSGVFQDITVVAKELADAITTD